MDLNELNPEQREAAETLEGPVLILAGAGSGKTRALTYRIANLIDHGVDPWNILAITFTNKAAREMRERVSLLSGDRGNEVWVSTFHSMCARILRRDIEKMGYTRSFSIYDDEDQNTLLKEIYRTLNIDDKLLPLREVKTKISDAKNKLLSPDEWFAQSGRDFRCQQIHNLYTAYETRLRTGNALDFDDLLVRTLELFADHPPVLEAYRRRFRYVHVDEYQDTNFAQYSLVKLLTQESRNLCVVGDDDKSIYSWRGADIRNILDFQKDFPSAKVIRLEQNYRSTANILDAANQVIAHNKGRMEKSLWTERDAGEKIYLYRAGDERDEAAWVCQELRSMNKEGREYGDTAVLYRSNAQSRVLEEMLMRSGIPYRVFGGLRFYDRKEVKDIVAYLRVLVNPADDVSLKRIINVPRRAIGDTTVGELQKHAAANEMPIFSALSDLPDSLSSRAKKSVTAFSDLMGELLLAKEEMKVARFAQFVVEKTGLRTQYEKEDTEEAKTHLENIDEFLGAVQEYENGTQEPTLEDYLENVALISDLDKAELAGHSVTLMTIHSAKGLEFPVVFLTGMEEGLFPNNRSMNDPARLEEERRLCYVAITRAQIRLLISYAGMRLLYNQMNYNAPSRFLREIPARLLEDGRRGEKRAPARKMTPSQETRQRAAATQGAGIGAHSASLGIPGLQKGFGNASQGVGTGIFQPGDRIMHRKFGQGRVKEVRGSGASARVVIDFDQGGSREFVLSIAPIVKMGD